MIKNYRNVSYMDYRQDIQDNFGKEGISSFCKDHNVKEYIAKKMIAQAETKTAEYLQSLENGECTRARLEDIDPKLVKTAHDEYIECFGQCADKDKVAYVILGNASSGKSSRLAGKLLKGFPAITVDSDIVRLGGKNSFRESYNGLSSIHRDVTDIQKYLTASNELGKSIVRDVANDGYNLILPKTTTSLAELYRNIQILASNGYEINLIQCENQFDECANRNYYRYLKAIHNGSHPRFIPLSILKDIDDKPFRVFCSAYRDSLQGSTPFNDFKIFYALGKLQEIDTSSMQMKFDEQSM